MQLSVDRLHERLTNAALDPTYFFYGDEPLQLTECGDALRKQAAAAGIAERIVLNIDGAADWETVRAESGAMSLFAERRLIEIRLGSRKPDKAGTDILAGIATRAADLDIYLISAGKLDGAARKAAWFKALEKDAVCVTTRDPPAAQLPAWLARRAARFDKKLSREAANLIAERVEGNLLAAAQEVEKLCLLVAAPGIDAADVINAVTDSARFDVYQFVDALVGADLARALRILRGLREEGTEPVLVNWALGRELRQLAQMSGACGNGGDIARVIDQYRVWGNRKGLVRGALERHTADDFLALLTYANFIDTVIKGGRPGSPWDEIEILALRMCRAKQAGRLMTTIG